MLSLRDRQTCIALQERDNKLLELELELAAWMSQVGQDVHGHVPGPCSRLASTVLNLSIYAAKDTGLVLVLLY